MSSLVLVVPVLLLLLVIVPLGSWNMSLSIT
jgi:hypothetical protein